jgi:hypothetical protein
VLPADPATIIETLPLPPPSTMADGIVGTHPRFHEGQRFCVTRF